MSVKSIIFKVEMVGHGGVNYDSKEQKGIWNKLTSKEEQVPWSFSNVLFLKKRFYKKENGEIDRKIVISADCLRHYIFIDDFPYQISNIDAHVELLHKSIANIPSILRGYMYTKTAIKKKSCICITEAQQTNDAISTIEFFSKSGKKNTELVDESDNSIFKKEIVGDVKYEFFGGIDIKEMSFCSMCELYDRIALHPDYFDGIYKPNFEKYSNYVLNSPAYYIPKKSISPLAEYGFVFTKEQIVDMTREFFKRLLRLNIYKSSNGWANVFKVKIKYVEDVLKDNFYSKEGWVDLTSENDIDFIPEEFYECVNFEESIKIKKEYEESIKNHDELKKEKKKDKENIKNENKKKRDKNNKVEDVIEE